MMNTNNTNIINLKNICVFYVHHSQEILCVTSAPLFPLCLIELDVRL